MLLYLTNTTFIDLILYILILCPSFWDEKYRKTGYIPFRQEMNIRSGDDTMLCRNGHKTAEDDPFLEGARLPKWPIIGFLCRATRTSVLIHNLFNK